VPSLAPWIALGVVLGGAGLAWLCWLRPLSATDVERELGTDPDLFFELNVGVENAACAASAADDPSVAERTAAALAAGWLARKGEGGHAELVLTPVGRQIVARSRYEPTTCEPAAGRGAVTTYTLPVARFERFSQPVLEPDGARTRRRVVVRGRWIPTAEGKALARAGWRPLGEPAVREEHFELRICGWRRIPNLIGHDVPGL
jgi:hypothetical protein